MYEAMYEHDKALEKPYGINPRYYWAHLGGTHSEFENPLETKWEYDENTLGKRGGKKSLFPPPLGVGKNWVIHESMLSLPIDCMKFLFPKLFIIIFGLG
jgi:hypothetical protein